MLTEQEKWRAFAANDIRYDGLFFAGVTSTGIYCKPSCTARTPLRKNVTFYDSGEQCTAAGFRPCKRCRPDLLDYRPAEQLAESARLLIEKSFAERTQLLEEIGQLGVTRNHLSAVFRRLYNETPFEYRNRLRMEQAKQLLLESELSVTDIAFACGFDSLSAFYSAFSRTTGTNPGTYRKQQEATT